MPMGVGVNISDYFVPKLEILDSLPRLISPIEQPPPITELRRNFQNNNLNNLNFTTNNSTNYNPNNSTTTATNNSIHFNFNSLKPSRPHIIPPDSSISLSSSLSSPRLLLSPTTPSTPITPATPISTPSTPSSILSPPEEDTTSPTFFIDSYTKIRTLSGEIFQCAGETLAKGCVVADHAKIEYYAHELLKVAKQLSNTPQDNDDKKRPTPPLVRPRRIRRKHNDDDELEDGGDRKRKIGLAAPEMYCHSCGTTDTPEWRRGPDNCKSLCNACGLHYAKMLRRETMIPNRAPARATMTLNNLLN